MCWFCDCKHSRQWRSGVEQKLDMILHVVSGMTHLSPEDRATIQSVTAKLKAQTDATNAALAANDPTKIAPPKGETP